MKEQWRPVVEFPKHYVVSNKGRVRRKGSETDRRLQRDKDGYLFLVLCVHGTHYPRKAHRLVLEAFVGPCPAGQETRHKDGNNTNNCVTNLMWSTPTKNAHDKKVHGTLLIGERHPNAKLTRKDVRRIRQLYATGKHTQRRLATRFNIGQAQISRIINEQRWTEVRT